MLSAGLTLAGCVGAVDAPSPLPTDAAPTAAPTSSPGGQTASPVPRLVPDGTAAENLPMFASVVDAVWTSETPLQGSAYIDALATEGFAIADMERTADLSTVGEPAESIQFSVRWADECLIGQVGPGFEAPVTIVAPLLAEGTCLVGATVPVER